MVMEKLISKIKDLIGKIKVPQVKMPAVPKIKMPDLKPWLLKGLVLLKKVPGVAFRLIKGFVVWFGKAVKESIAQVWTLLGFFIAWLTLTGTAQQIVGLATIFATILWLVTIPLREEKPEE